MIRGAGLAATLLVMPLTAHAQATVETCAPDGQIMLLQDYATFDQSGRGWRSMDRPGCEAAAADQIARYRTLQRNLLAASEAQLLSWHEGQLRAGLGDTAGALKLFAEAYDTETADNPWNPYVDATIAFLKRDRVALTAARDRLAALPPSPNFVVLAAEYQQRTGRVLRWPPNIAVVEGLISCFDRSYREAYGPSCRQ